MAQEFRTIEQNIKSNILRRKITEFVEDFAIKSIEPIKDKATTNRVVPLHKRVGYENEKGFHAWQTNFEIDGYKGYASITLQKDHNGEPFLSLYSHAYNDELDCYAPDIACREVWLIGAEEQTWETFLQDLRNRKANRNEKPTAENIEDFLKKCEEMKDSFEKFSKEREKFSEFYGSYFSETPNRWSVRG